jgi:hypothetical protein
VASRTGDHVGAPVAGERAGQPARTEVLGTQTLDEIAVGLDTIEDRGSWRESE